MQISAVCYTLVKVNGHLSGVIGCGLGINGYQLLEKQKLEISTLNLRFDFCYLLQFMDFKAQLTKEHSKENRDVMVNYLLERPGEIDGLMDQFFSPNHLLVQRAAWVVGTLGERNPELIRPYFPKMVKEIRKKDAHVAVRRNVLRVLQFQDVDEELWGELYDTCIRFLEDKNEPVAVKAFAMSTAFKIVKKVPELKDELSAAIEQILPEGTPGEKSRGQKILSALSKL